MFQVKYERDAVEHKGKSLKTEDGFVYSEAPLPYHTPIVSTMKNGSFGFSWLKSKSTYIQGEYMRFAREEYYGANKA